MQWWWCLRLSTGTNKYILTLSNFSRMSYVISKQFCWYQLDIAYMKSWGLLHQPSQERSHSLIFFARTWIHPNFPRGLTKLWSSTRTLHFPTNSIVFLFSFWTQKTILSLSHHVSTKNKHSSIKCECEKSKRWRCFVDTI